MRACSTAKSPVRIFAATSTISAYWLRLETDSRCKQYFKLAREGLSVTGMTCELREGVRTEGVEGPSWLYVVSCGTQQSHLAPAGLKG